MIHLTVFIISFVPVYWEHYMIMMVSQLKWIHWFRMRAGCKQLTQLISSVGVWCRGIQ